MWMIEIGEYSDYKVFGPFSTEENAKLFLSKIKHPYNVTIGKWELDPDIEMIKENHNLKIYRISMLYDGYVDCIFENTIEDYIPLKVYNGEETRYVTGDVWAKNEQHAIKIANEFRAQAIANGILVRVNV